MNKILNPLQFCVESTIGGIHELYISSRSQWGRRWLYEETSNLQYGRIDGSLTIGSFYKLANRINGTTFNQIQELEPSRSYIQTLNVSFNRMDIIKRDSIEQWVVSKDPIFILKDYNGFYWLMGETNGCSIQWTANTDDKFGINGDNLTITCRERFPIRQVTDSFVDTYIAAPVHLCDYTWAEVCALSWPQVCATPW